MRILVTAAVLMAGMESVMAIEEAPYTVVRKDKPFEAILHVA